jgi:hypothetical protein
MFAGNTNSRYRSNRLIPAYGAAHSLAERLSTACSIFLAKMFAIDIKHLTSGLIEGARLHGQPLPSYWT